MHPKDISIGDFVYELPQKRIAQHPVEPRDQSRLLLVRGNRFEESRYARLADHLPSPCSLLFNQTRVLPARLWFRKPTGKRIEIFCLEPADPGQDPDKAMQQVGQINYRCLIGGAARWKPEQWIGLDQPDPDSELEARWMARDQEGFRVDFRWRGESSFADLLERVGKIPIPPYLNREAEFRDQFDYQTIYARQRGSVAAPTAGLHFTPSLMRSLEIKGIGTEFVSLHVGAGTFRPVKSPTMEGHAMHAEWMDIPLSTLVRIRDQMGKAPWIAVGTTSLRLVESLYWIGLKIGKGIFPEGVQPAVDQWDPYEWAPSDSPVQALDRLIQWMDNQNRERLTTRTRILICPGYRFQIIEGLITNFHQPASTLLLLVAAMEKNWRAAYAYALDHDFRFLSYGDGCLFLPGR